MATSFTTWSQAWADTLADVGQATGHVVEDPPNAPFVQTRHGPRSPRAGGPGAFPQDVVVPRRADRQHPLPELLTLGDLARPRLIRTGQIARGERRQRLFLLEGPMMLATAIDEPVAGHPHEEGAQVGRDR